MEVVKCPCCTCTNHWPTDPLLGDRKDSNFSSCITFVYGLHSTQQRASLWDTLRTVNYNGPWLILGDFNSVLGVDRINGQPVHHSEMTNFQNYIDDIGVGQITKRGNMYSNLEQQKRLWKQNLQPHWLGFWQPWMVQHIHWSGSSLYATRMLRSYTHNAEHWSC